VPTDSQIMTKNKTFPLHYSLACTNYATNLFWTEWASLDGWKIS